MQENNSTEWRNSNTPWGRTEKIYKSKKWICEKYHDNTTGDWIIWKYVQ